MSKAVAVISDTGVLVDALGKNKETNERYAKFSQRLIGSSTATASLNYGWNGASKLDISKGGSRGQQITLNADTVVFPGNLKVGGIDLQDLIDTCTDIAIQGIVGTDEEIKVIKTENPPEEGKPRITCTISLDPSVTDKIKELEKTIEDLFRFEEVYRIGDGLRVIREESNILSVKLGTGLTFEENSSSDEDDAAAITLDADPMPIKDSVKPVTSGGVYAAIHGGIVEQEYSVGVDATTGNMMLYHNT